MAENLHTKHHPRSIQALAERYGLCRATIYNAAKRGELVLTKLGGRTIVLPEDEAAWVQRGRQISAAAKGVV